MFERGLLLAPTWGAGRELTVGQRPRRLAQHIRWALVAGYQPDSSSLSERRPGHLIGRSGGDRIPLRSRCVWSTAIGVCKPARRLINRCPRRRFTVAVAPVAPGTGQPSGTASIFDGGTRLGSAIVVNGGHLHDQCDHSRQPLVHGNLQRKSRAPGSVVRSASGDRDPHCSRYGAGGSPTPWPGLLTADGGLDARRRELGQGSELTGSHQFGRREVVTPMISGTVKAPATPSRRWPPVHGSVDGQDRGCRISRHA